MLLSLEPDLNQPSSIEWGESPDIVCKWGCKTAGVEFTISNQETEMKALRIAESDPRLKGRATCWSGMSDLPVKPNREEIISRLRGLASWDNPFLVVDGVVGKVVTAIEKKNIKLNSPHFRVFDENWLVVVEYLGGVSNAWTAEIFIEKMLQNAPAPFADRLNFDRIYVVYGEAAILLKRDLSHSVQTVHFTLEPRLWEPTWEFRK